MMKDWPHKARDLAIAETIMAQAAVLNDGVLSLLDGCQENQEKGFTFQFPAWVMALSLAFETLYGPEEHIGIMGNVLDEVTKNFKGFSREDARLFRELVKLALVKNLAVKLLH